jgi:hypothetical protein
MDLDLNFEPLIKIDSDKESEIDESSEYVESVMTLRVHFRFQLERGCMQKKT